MNSIANSVNRKIISFFSYRLHSAFDPALGVELFQLVQGRQQIAVFGVCGRQLNVETEIGIVNKMVQKFIYISNSQK